MRSKKLYLLTLFGCLLTFGVILLGSYTRLTDAGLGCPDWPGCYGHLTVPATPDALAKASHLYPNSPIESQKAWTEMIHRYFAGSLGLIVMIVSIGCLRYYRNRIHPVLPITLMALILFQAALGMWTVTLRLLPTVVMGHLLGGFLTLGLLWLTTLRLRTINTSLPSAPSAVSLRFVGSTTLCLLFLQIFLGGWTSSNYAALVCPDFPTCLGQWWPPFDLKAFDLTTGFGYETPTLAMTNTLRVVIQSTHRLGALLLSLSALWLGVLLWKAQYRKLCVWMMALLSLQIMLGIGNVIGLLPLHVAVSHTGVAALLWLTLIAVNHRVWSRT